MLEKTTVLFRPKLIIAGASAHPQDFGYARMRKVIRDFMLFSHEEGNKRFYAVLIDLQ